jgi:hypothetical protein
MLPRRARKQGRGSKGFCDKGFCNKGFCESPAPNAVPPRALPPAPWTWRHLSNPQLPRKNKCCHGSDGLCPSNKWAARCGIGSISRGPHTPLPPLFGAVMDAHIASQASTRLGTGNPPASPPC